MKEWDKQNKEKMAFYTRKKQLKRIAVINSHKDRPCMDCGGKFPPHCMDFDHREGTEKYKAVSRLINHSIERILEEIAKCDLVCANCHRTRTYERGLRRK